MDDRNSQHPIRAAAGGAVTGSRDVQPQASSTSPPPREFSARLLSSDESQEVASDRHEHDEGAALRRRAQQPNGTTPAELGQPTTADEPSSMSAPETAPADGGTQEIPLTSLPPRQTSTGNRKSKLAGVISADQSPEEWAGSPRMRQGTSTSGPSQRLGSHRSTAISEEMGQAAGRLERLNDYLLSSSSLDAVKASRPIARAAEIDQFIRTEFAEGLKLRLDRIRAYLGDYEATDLDVHGDLVGLTPFWDPTRSSSVHDPDLEDLLNVNNAGRRSTKELRELATRIKAKRPDADPQWVDTAVMQLASQKSRMEQLIWLARFVRKQFRGPINSLEQRVEMIRTSLNSTPSSPAQLIQRLIELDAKRAYVLEREPEIRFLASQCRELLEIQNVTAENVMPKNQTVVEYRQRLGVLQNDIAATTKRVTELDAKMMAAVNRIAESNRIFTQLMLNKVVS